jgi:hypothetical protein
MVPEGLQLDVEGDQPRFRDNLDGVLSGISPTWPIHVQLVNE